MGKDTSMTPAKPILRVAILAYGSLAVDPGEELDAMVHERIHPYRTPFAVEYARLSPHRGRGPVLAIVPDEEGEPVEGYLLLLNEGVSVESATRALWRRETHQVGSKKLPLGAERRDVQLTTRLAEADAVLYWAAPSNYPRPDAAGLARRAIDSARGPAGAARQDGISYLAQAIAAGIRTRLTDAYVAAVLEQTGAADLDGAWQWCRSQPRSEPPPETEPSTPAES
jgi:cation transport regulator ChaC